MNSLPGRLVLLGHPLGHSLSPAMQNAALRSASIPLTYEALDIPRHALDETLAELRRSKAAGNVTIPYKEVVADECDRLSEAAAATHAVNTFWVAVDGALVGDNTDAGGFQAAADALRFTQRNAVVAVLGAGGGAAAVLHAIDRWDGARVQLYARTRARADRLQQRHANTTVVDDVASALNDATLLVNATPVGLREGDSPVNAASLPPGCAVLDLTYRRGGTALVQQARARGLVAADGLTMLVEQGALAFERWFGVAPSRSVMWDALNRH